MSRKFPKIDAVGPPTSDFCLDMLGWTQEEIGGVIEISQGHVKSDYLSYFPESEIGIKNLLDSNLPSLEIAEHFK